MVLFGPPAAQQKAKEMIEEVVSEGSSRFRNGTYKVVFLENAGQMCLKATVIILFFSRAPVNIGMNTD